MSWYNSVDTFLLRDEADNDSSTNSDSDDSNASGSDLLHDDVTDDDDMVDSVSAGRATDPCMKQEQRRLDTFVTWPIAHIVSAQLLARDGFYYIGPADRVQCAFCDGVLCGWVKGDYPNVEHDKHFPDCQFICGKNVGNVPIAIDPRRHVESLSERRTTSNTTEHLQRVVENKKKYSIEEREVAARLDSVQVRTVMAMGYEKSLVHDVLKQRLESHGTDFTDMVSFVQALDEARNKLTQSRSASAAAQQTPVSAEPKAAASDDKKSHSKIRNKEGRKKKSKHKSRTNEDNCLSAETLTIRDDQHAAAGPSEAKKMQETTTNREVYNTIPPPSERQLASASLSDRCQWCTTGEANMAFIPCGHTFLCSTCSKSLNSCPHCGQAITRQLRIYLS